MEFIPSQAGSAYCFRALLRLAMYLVAACVLADNDFFTTLALRSTFAAGSGVRYLCAPVYCLYVGTPVVYVKLCDWRKPASGVSLGVTGLLGGCMMWVVRLE